MAEAAKVHRGVLLLRDRGWFWNSPEESLVPSRVVQKLLTHMESTEGLLSADDICELATANEAQAKRLRSIFPEVDYNRTPVFALVGKLPAPFRRRAARGRLSLRGVPLELIRSALGDKELDSTVCDWTLSVTGKAVSVPQSSGPPQDGLLVQAAIDRPGKPALLGAFLSRRRDVKALKGRIQVERAN